MRRYVRKSQTNRNFIVICCLFVVLIIISLIINISLRPVIYDIASQVGRQNIASLLNETVFDVLEGGNFDYNSFVDLNYNATGFVTSVQYDYKNINKLKIEIEELLLDKLSSLGNTKIKIPFGSLVGDLNSSGKGLGIKIRISQAAVPQISVVSTFESVGINQSRHEIRLVISAYAQLYLPPKKSEFSLTQEYVLAQTIIVGDIPQGFVTLG